MIKACLFDLDGVIVDTAFRHTQEWRSMADNLGKEVNEPSGIGLAGMDYRDSVETYRSSGGGVTGISPTDRRRLMNSQLYAYMDYLRTQLPNEVICGSLYFIEELRESGVKTGLCTASRNARVVVRRLGIDEFFDVVLEGHNFNHPNQLNKDVFLRAAEKLGVKPEECVAFEDTEAGIECAKKVGMKTVGVGNAPFLEKADYIIGSFADMDYRKLQDLFGGAEEESREGFVIEYRREVIIAPESE